MRERRQPAARARGRPPARDWHPDGGWRIAAPAHPAAAHRKPAALAGLRCARLRHFTARARRRRPRRDEHFPAGHRQPSSSPCRQPTGASPCSWWPARWSRPCSSRLHRRFRRRAWNWCGRFVAKSCVMALPAAPRCARRAAGDRRRRAPHLCCRLPAQLVEAAKSTSVSAWRVSSR